MSGPWPRFEVVEVGGLFEVQDRQRGGSYSLRTSDEKLAHQQAKHLNMPGRSGRPAPA